MKAYNKERIVTIHQMLFEMARGNFSSSIPLSSNEDELETLVVLIIILFCVIFVVLLPLRNQVEIIWHNLGLY